MKKVKVKEVQTDKEFFRYIELMMKLTDWVLVTFDFPKKQIIIKKENNERKSEN